MTRRGDTLELAVLGVLLDTPMHGYELRKQLIGMLGWGRVLSYGTLYPCLKALVKDGLIVAEEDTEVTLRGRRNRIVYHLTAEGKDRFSLAMEDSGPATWDDEHFGVRFAFFAQTDARTRVRILEGRRNRLEERLENVREASRRSRERADSYTRELQRHGLESVEREVRWLSELIERERTRADHAIGGAIRTSSLSHDPDEANSADPGEPEPLQTDSPESEPEPDQIGTPAAPGNNAAKPPAKRGETKARAPKEVGTKTAESQASKGVSASRRATRSNAAKTATTRTAAATSPPERNPPPTGKPAPATTTEATE